MTDGLISDVWCLIKEYADKKQVEALSEEFVALCSDYGEDDALKEALGVDPVLDDAVKSYYDIDESNWDE